MDYQNTVHGVFVIGDKIRVFRIHNPDAVDDELVFISSRHKVADGGEGAVAVLIGHLLGVFTPSIERTRQKDG